MLSKLKTFLLVLLLSLISLGATLVGAEFYFRPRGKAQEWKIAPIHRPDPELSYSGIPGAGGVDSIKVGDKYQFNVYLQLNEYGFREVPGAKAARGSRCVLLLGDSVAFGIGVEAEKTVAALLQGQLKDTRVINLGYSGWGPHQTLRLLELGRERPQLEGCREVKAYYFGAEDNFWRALGRANWGMSSPKYRMVGDELTYQGPYVPEWLNEWNNNLNHYQVVTKLVLWWIGYGKEVSPWEREVYIKIMRKIRDILTERYQAEFRTIYFVKGQDPRGARFRKLEAPGLDVNYFETIAGARGVPLDQMLGRLYLPDQTHMNEAGHRLLADAFLAGELAPWLKRAGR